MLLVVSFASWALILTIDEIWNHAIDPPGPKVIIFDDGVLVYVHKSGVLVRVQTQNELMTDYAAGPGRSH